ncbi:MAG: hypothetical protein AB7I19_18085 [Planctomycetota bacterium]
MFAPKIAISTVLVACAIPTAAAATPQVSASTPPIEESPTAMIAEGERLLRVGEKEGAAIMAWRARDLLRLQPEDSGSAVLRNALDGLMMRADPLATRGREEDAAFAERLVELGRDYQRRKLPRRALAVLDLAMRFDPVAAGKLRDYVLKQPGAKPAGTAKPDEPAKAGRKAERGQITTAAIHWADPGWKIEEGIAKSPPLHDNKTKRLMLNEPRHGSNDEISCDLLLGDAAGHAGIVILLSGVDQYFVVELSHVLGSDGVLQTNLRVFRIEGTKAENLATKFFSMTASQRADWFTLRAIVRDDQLEIPVPGTEPMRVAIDGKLGDGLGFFVSGNSDYKGSVHYRNLRVQPAPERAPAKSAGDAPPPAPPIVATIDGLLAKKVPPKEVDEHLVELHRALDELPSVTDPTLRELLDLRLREGITKADPLAKLALTVRTERARTLAGRAAAYRDAQCPRLSLTVLAAAARYDWQSAKADYLALLASLAPPPPPPLPPARPSELLHWFTDMEQVEGPGGWTVSAERLVPPLIEDSAQLAVVGKPRQPETGKLSVDFVMSPDSRAGLVFDYRSLHDVAVVWLVPAEGRLVAAPIRAYSGNRSELGKIEGPSLPTAGPIYGTLTMEFLPGKVLLRLFDSEPLELPLADRAATPRLGVICTTAGAGVEVRNWFVESTSAPAEKR